MPLWASFATLWKQTFSPFTVDMLVVDHWPSSVASHPGQAMMGCRSSARTMTVVESLETVAFFGVSKAFSETNTTSPTCTEEECITPRLTQNELALT